MTDKLLIVMANADPRSGIAVAPALSQALVAAAMSYKVEIIFTGRAGELVKQGVASSVHISSASDRTVYDMIRDAREAGVKIKVCTAALEFWGGAGLIPEVEETVGSAYLISEAMDKNTVVFTY